MEPAANASNASDESPVIDYTWTTGGDEAVSHRALIDVGAFGAVHWVFFIHDPH